MPAIDMNLVTSTIRFVQAIFDIIVLGLSGYVASWWTGYWHHVDTPSQVSFLIFTSVWTILALVYLILVPLRFSNSVIHHKFAIVAVESITTIFWFAGFVALAVFLTDRQCKGTVCESAQAATVFAAFQWVLFTATTTFAAMHVFRTTGRTDTVKANPNITLPEGV